MGLTVADVETALAAIGDKTAPVFIEIVDGGPASFTVPGYTFLPGAHRKPLESVTTGAVIR